MIEYILAWHIDARCKAPEDFRTVMKNIFSNLSEKNENIRTEEKDGLYYIHLEKYSMKCRFSETAEEIKMRYLNKYKINVNFEIVCELPENECSDEYFGKKYSVAIMALIDDLPAICKDRTGYILMTNKSGNIQFKITGKGNNYSLFFGEGADIFLFFREYLSDVLYKSGLARVNLFEKYDKIISSIKSAQKYAEEHFEEILERAESADKTVLTSYANWLGIADPSLIEHRVVRGSMRGRIIKEIPEDGEHTKILYKDGKLAAVRSYNSFGREESYFFFEFEDFVWAVSIYADKEDKKYYGKASYSDSFRLKYDENGRIISRYMIRSNSFIGEEYEYPADENEPIKCVKYYYVPGLSGSSKSIPAGYENSPMDENYYEISRDMKVIRAYVKKGEEYVFCREYVSGGKKAAKPKPAADTYEKLSKWLDELLSDIPEKAKGLFFCLDEGTEDGFGIDPFFTSRFDEEDEDWACDEIKNPDEFFVSVNGKMEWEDILKYSSKTLKKYVKEGEKRGVVKSLDGAGVGFSDGDIIILCKKRKKKNTKGENK